MTSREYAELLRKQAAELDGLPEFPVPDYFIYFGKSITYYYEKSAFLSAVRALGTGTKEVVGDKMRFMPKGAAFYLEIERDSVCRKVREAEYECEPLLSDEEQAAFDAATAPEGIPF